MIPGATVEAKNTGTGLVYTAGSSETGNYTLPQLPAGTYEITVISGRTGDILVRGGRFFPEFTAARLAGSSLGGSFLKLRGVYLGFNLEIHFDQRLIITSRVRQISIPVQ